MKKTLKGPWTETETELLHKVVDERLEMGWRLHDAAAEASKQLIDRSINSCYNKWKYDKGQRYVKKADRVLESEEHEAITPEVVNNQVQEDYSDITEIRISYRSLRIDPKTKEIVITV